MSILHSLAAEDNERPVWFVHGARDGSHHSLTQEVRELAANRSNISTQVAYSRPRLEDKLGTHYDSEGRIEGTLLTRIVDNFDAHYFFLRPNAIHGEHSPSLRESSSARGTDSL